MVGARQLLHHHQRENNLQFLLDEIVFKNIKYFHLLPPSAAASHPIGLMDATATLLMRKILKLIHFNLNSS